MDHGSGNLTEIHRAHNKAKSGRGAKEKKKEKLDKQKGNQKERHNSRAFSVAKVGRAQKSIQRNLDRNQKKEYVPLKDRREEEIPPPPLVAVMGPPGVGKSTLIRSLVKMYTNHNLQEIVGPITVVTGKNKRITLMECPNDPCAQLDVAKVADLVLLCVDAKFGFEMETFEFLNILQTHGFPKVMGVFTHLDQFRTMKNLRKTKKNLKDRFWTEIYNGAKMFYFSGTINEKFLKHEVKQLSLFISRVKYRPLIWRNTHPYIVVDRHEDITHPNHIQQNPACDRSISFYGYVRGTHLRPGNKVHLIGAGDFNMTEITAVPDPCPLPEQQQKMETLNKKSALLYAPLSNVGAVTFDKDAVYIDIGRANYTKKENLTITDKANTLNSDETEENEEEMEVIEEYDSDEPAGLLKSLQDVENGVDEKMSNSTLRLFKKSKAQIGTSVPESDDDDSDSNNERKRKTDIDALVAPFRRRWGEAPENDSEDGDSEDESDTEADSSDESDDESDDENKLSGEDSYEESNDEGSEADSNKNSSDMQASALWKKNLAQKAAESYLGRELSHVNLQELIYGVQRSSTNVVSDDEGKELKNNPNEDEGEESDESDDEFFTVKSSSGKAKSSTQRTSQSNGGKVNNLPVMELPEDDSSRIIYSTGDNENNQSTSIEAFNVSVWLEKGEDCLLETLRDRFVTGKWNKDPAEAGDDDEEFGDFEDLETGEKFGPGNDNENSEDDDGSDDGVDTSGMTDEELREYNAKKKAQRKTDFDKDYDDEKKGMVDGAVNDPDAKAEAEYIEALKREKAARLKRNKEEFGEEGEAARLRHEGYRQGIYCRVRIDGVPAEFVESFNPKFPVVIGGLTPQETNLGFVRCRFKKHRWHKKILKCNDPLVFSIGWRRFQSLPVFSTEDENGRYR